MPKGVYKRTIKPMEDRFWEKVNKTNTCWEWQAAISSAGYGKFRYEGKWASAHRIMWEMKNGKIPKGKLILHHCDNKICINLKHLYLGTAQDNARDREKRNDYNKGENHWCSKLTKEKVLEIRKKYILYEYPQHKLAEEYNISRSVIGKVLNRKIWKHI